MTKMLTFREIFNPHRVESVAFDHHHERGPRKFKRGHGDQVDGIDRRGKTGVRSSFLRGKTGVREKPVSDHLFCGEKPVSDHLFWEKPVSDHLFWLIKRNQHRVFSRNYEV
jgi:hypothetical protein